MLFSGVDLEVGFHDAQVVSGAKGDFRTASADSRVGIGEIRLGPFGEEGNRAFVGTEQGGIPSARIVVAIGDAGIVLEHGFAVAEGPVTDLGKGGIVHQVGGSFEVSGGSLIGVEPSLEAAVEAAIGKVGGDVDDSLGAAGWVAETDFHAGVATGIDGLEAIDPGIHQAECGEQDRGDRGGDTHFLGNEIAVAQRFIHDSSDSAEQGLGFVAEIGDGANRFEADEKIGRGFWEKGGDVEQIGAAKGIEDGGGRAEERPQSILVVERLAGGAFGGKGAPQVIKFERVGVVVAIVALVIGERGTVLDGPTGEEAGAVIGAGIAGDRAVIFGGIERGGVGGRGVRGAAGD